MLSVSFIMGASPSNYFIQTHGENKQVVFIAGLRAVERTTSLLHSDGWRRLLCNAPSHVKRHSAQSIFTSISTFICSIPLQLLQHSSTRISLPLNCGPICTQRMNWKSDRRKRSSSIKTGFLQLPKRTVAKHQNLQLLQDRGPKRKPLEETQHN